MLAPILASICCLAPAALMAAEGMRVVAACDEVHYRHSEGSAMLLPDGRMLLAWSRFDGPSRNCGTLGDNGPATIVMAESADQGATWSAPVALPVGTATRNIMQAAFVPVRGRLMLAFSVRMREGHQAAKYAIESGDGGRTWSERRQLFDAHGPNDRAIRLASGRILMGCHRRSDRLRGRESDPDVLIARSDDEGRTWTLGDPIPHRPHAMETAAEPEFLKTHEPAIAECPDGSVLLLVRTTSGSFYQSRSVDGGITWPTLEPTAIESFAAPPYLLKLADGRLLLLSNPFAGRNAAKAVEAKAKGQPVPYGPRARLDLAVSADGGRTWGGPRTIAEEKGKGFCYPWALQRTDRQVHVFCSRTPEIIYPADLVQLAPFSP